ncbi:N-acetylmuramoyl-L-alanine amidase [Litoribacter ruber]|uniref:N-acetylmuramoyl-L-alanine amidase n=1 Tax=Litoribacter ruber TaxID=702568 RepID=UPI001BD9582B|nr:peptidoglycan recognition family protein [Litoribacter ruber]MBT0810232.1 N-acetylmuramoyl-L-alanine amidase [Litoribacter ruber]
MNYQILSAKALIFVFLINFSCTSKATFRTFDKYITFDEERIELSLRYLNERHGIDTESIEIEPKMVVLHWTVVPSIEKTFDVFDPAILPSAREGLQGASALNVSSQYLVDRDGTIFKLMPENHFARHTIGLNHCAVGIENIGSDEMPLTKAQEKANEQIIRYLKSKYAITHVIGHHEYQLFKDHPYWKETDPNYLTVKTDPGDKFMRAVRKRIADLNLLGVEEAGASNN